MFTCLSVAGGAGASAKFFPTQDALVELRDNNCVNCHAKLSSPLRLTSRYAEWHMSTHKEKAVGCEKCHGGDSKISDHQGIVSSFVESKHYQNLKSAGLGPSCTTCHQHMASQVLYTPDETSAMCSTCHNSPNKFMPPSPEVPQKANEVMQSIRRANTLVVWADRLLEEADKRKLDVSEEKKEQKIVRAVLAEAKISWHAFNLDSVRRKADDAFEMGTKVKDSLRAKLYPQQ